MIELRPFSSLGRFEASWLSARYHFSFADYVDPRRMGVGPLRVWNDDTVRAGGGFPMHPHRDMEIVTYIRTGAISHRDGLGHEGRTEAGNVQIMSAGTGIRHSEYNAEPEDMTLFQIWIVPRRTGLPPRWENREFPHQPGLLVPLASGRDIAGHEGALVIHQDAAILGATLGRGQSVSYPLAGRRAYLVATRGAVEVNGTRAEPRDGVLVTEEDTLTLHALDDAEVVVADLP